MTTDIQSMAYQMYIKRDGSVHGPLWPREIKGIVLDKLEKQVKPFYFASSVTVFTISFAIQDQKLS